MRTVVSVVGGLFLVAVVILVIGGAWTVTSVGVLVGEAKGYADRAIPAIAANWDRGELLKRLSSDARSTLGPDAFGREFDAFASFGGLVDYDGAICVVNAALPGKRPTTARCTASAKCAKAFVAFRLDLVRRGKAWAIADFAAHDDGPNLRVSLAAPN